MKPGLRFTLSGVADLEKALNSACRTRALNALKAGVYAQANAAATSAKRKAPKLYGVLRGSIYATLPRSTGKDTVASVIGAGGPAEKYARAQHEGTNGIVIFRNYTTPGTGPKFIEKAIEEIRASPQIFAKAAKNAWLNGGMGGGNTPATPNQGPRQSRSRRRGRR